MQRAGAFTYTADAADADYLDDQKVHRLQWLAPFFTPERLRELLIPFLDGTSSVSLRHLDHLINGYAPAPVWCHEGRLIRLRDVYACWLSVWKRRLFDLFRRHARCRFELDGVLYTTTPAQLNFVYFASATGLLTYAHDHRAEIDASMRDANRQRRLDTATYRRAKHIARKSVVADLGVFSERCITEF